MPSSALRSRSRAGWRAIQFGQLGPLALAGLLALLVPTGCDNVACVFGPGNCTGNAGGGTPGVGANPATIPVDGEWIGSVAPKITGFFPTGTLVASTSPIVIVFSESLDPDTVANAFELQVGTLNAVPLNNVTLVGDGRVVIALPATPLVANTLYMVLTRTSVVLVDRAGRSFVPDSNGMIGTFTTAATDPTTPRVVTSWPPDSVTDQSTTTQAVVVFDRAIDPTSINGSSFAVTVNGNPPQFNPTPAAVAGSLGLGPDTRAFTYRSVDTQGNPVSLGLSSSVQINLSPLGSPIRDTLGQFLPNTTISFTTADFGTPKAASITSIPTDAIGINEISGPQDLAVKVDLDGAQTGDFLDLYMVGTAQGVPLNPPLLALFREVQITLPTGSSSFTMTASEIDLLQNSSPVQARFADGNVSFAFLVRRDTSLSPVRMLDTDTTTLGVQPPVLDTVPPSLLGLGTLGGPVDSFSSDVRDVTLIGQSSETLEGAVVSTPLGSNVSTKGMIPQVTGTNFGGLFVAAPVHLGIVPPASLPLGYTITLYDKALNASIPATGNFQQLGASGPGTALPGGNVSVDVFDASTLLPIPGAQVFTHQDAAGVVTAVATATADANGHASLAAAPSAGMETIVTVSHPGYDLFTFDGVPTARLSVPLEPTQPPGLSTFAAGTVSTTSSTIGLATKSVGDSRAPDMTNSLFSVNSCTQGGTLFTCPFGPSTIISQRVGAQAALAVLVPANPFQFSPGTFLKGYQPSLPVPPAFPGGTSENSISFTVALDDPSLDPTELPVDGAPMTTLSTVNYPLLITTASPRILLEAKTPGIPGALAVGQGVAYDDTSLMLPPQTWLVKAAYPGAVETTDAPPLHTLGRLAIQGTVEAPLMLRAEITDTAGNIGGVRERLPFTMAALLPPAPPVLGSPAVVANSGLAADDLTFTDVIPDAAAEPGIYRVTLTDSTGVRWTIYRPDAPDSAGPNAIAHLPYAGPSNMIPLAPGPVQCQISAFAWPGFDITQFLWTDIEREHDLYSHTASATIPTLP
jgi:Bacterial Ig-like domain